MATTTQTQYADDFKCPISLEIMSDPVIISSGHTFDRSSIQRWLDAGHRTCPVTKLPLSDPPSLIPNHALRSLISHYTAATNITGTTTGNVNFSKPFQNQVNPETLISNLTSKSVSPESKLGSLEQMCSLSKRDFELRKRLTESGAVAAVLGCVSGSGNNSGLQEKALKFLLNLSLDDDNKVSLVAEGAICNIIAALCGGGSADCRATAATVLTSLAVVEVNKATIGAYPFAIRGLVMLLREGGGRERKEAATALYALCSYPDNRRRAVECGAVAILVDSLDAGLERAVEVLGLLAKCKRGREEMLRINGLVRILIHVLKNGSSRGVQYALLTLNSLCLNSEVICVQAMKEGVFELCLRFFEDDNEKVRRNASSLVKVFGGASCV